MRRESSTVIALVGHLSGGQLAALEESGNVAVVRKARAGPDPAAGSGPAAAAGPEPAEPLALAAWEPGARALRAAARRRATYVVVASDPLAGVASAWRAMWDLAGGPDAAARFEVQAADTLAAWRHKQFELPDYYLVVASAEAAATGPDLHLGPLRAARPRRVAVTGAANRSADPAAGPALTASLLDTLRSLEHGPWWPPLDELLDVARRFNAGGLAENQPSPG